MIEQNVSQGTFFRKTSATLREKSILGWIIYALGMGTAFWAVHAFFGIDAWLILKVYLSLEVASGFMNGFTNRT